MRLVRFVCLYMFFALIKAIGLFNSFVVRQEYHNNDSVRNRLESLAISSSHIPFFKNYFRKFLRLVKGQSDELFFTEWSKLPVLTKQDYISIDFQLKEPDVSPGILQTIWQLRYGKFGYSLSTGGSSSTPLLVKMDKAHAFKMAFSFFLCWYKMGWRIGDKILIFYPNRIYNLELFQKYKLFSYLFGIKFVTFDRLDDETTESFISCINSYRPDLLIIFPSPLNLLSHKILSNRVSNYHQPKLINVSGETLFKCQRDNIQRAFPNSKLEDSYGSVELGEIAHEVSDCKLEVFDHHAYVESINSDNDKKEIIVTIFGNGYFPMIRYRMGDIMDFTGENGKNYLLDINGKPTNKITIGKTCIYPRDLDKFIVQVNNLFMVKVPIISDVRLIKDGENLILQLMFAPNLCEDFSCGFSSFTQDNIANSISKIFCDQFEVRPKIEAVTMFKHDYRFKYRALINNSEELEWAGGIIGQKDKMKFTS